MGGLECFDGLIFRQIWNQNGWYRVLKVVPLDHIDSKIHRLFDHILSPWRAKIFTSLCMLGGELSGDVVGKLQHLLVDESWASLEQGPVCWTGKNRQNTYCHVVKFSFLLILFLDVHKI